MHLVGGSPLTLAVPELLHSIAVAAAPSVGEGLPVAIDAEACTHYADLAGDRSSPIDYCAEHVEYKCFYVGGIAIHLDS